MLADGTKYLISNPDLTHVLSLNPQVVVEFDSWSESTLS